jgi:hypothetical protein
MIVIQDHGAPDAPPAAVPVAAPAKVLREPALAVILPPPPARSPPASASVVGAELDELEDHHPKT